MASFMLTISFIIHVIVLIAVFFLFHQISKIKNDYFHEIKQLFEKYIADIKEENSRLEMILKDNRETKLKTDYLEQPLVDHSESEDERQTTEMNIETDEDTVETSLQAKILQLYNEGLPVDKIAKKLNCGKTEAELIINLYHQKK